MSISDKEYYQLTMSISKALNSMEMPMKSKHIRAAIIGTFHTRGGHAFWAIATRQPLQENRITVYKFCHLLHKILREGHPLCCQHSMRHRTMLNELGKLWGHLNDGYGLSIKLYTKLLVTKLEFHDRNPHFPGSLVLKRGQLEKIGGNNNDFYFQMSVEMFDYLDDIIALQATIFNSLSTFYVNSMTAPGQCRLAPLIPLIQDSNQLYDFIVRIMFRLHANLPAEILTGHRERFRAVFTQLKSFYSQSRSLQYFQNLITVPKLPDTQPNFMLQSDLGNYTAPVVVMPDSDNISEADLVEENLVDTATPPEQSQPPPVPELPARHRSPPPPDFDKLLTERDNLIRHLQIEVERLSVYIKTTVHQQRDHQAQLENQVANLTQELTAARGELANLRIEKEELELKADAAPSLELKAIAVEEKAKAQEEKFQKLKTMYTQIRDDHIKLIRQHDAASKQVAASTKIISETNRVKEELKCQVDEMQANQSQIEETLQRSGESDKAEKEELTMKLIEVQADYSALQIKCDDVNASRSAEIAELKVNLDVLSSELKETKETCENLLTEKLRLQEDYNSVMTAKEEFESKLTEMSGTVGNLESQTQEQIAEKETLHVNLESQRKENEGLKNQLEMVQTEQHELNERCAVLTTEKLEQETELKEQLDAHQTELIQLTDKLSTISTELSATEEREQQVLVEIEGVKEQLAAKTAELFEFEQQTEAKLKKKEDDLTNVKVKCEELEEQYKKLSSDMDRMTNEKCTIESDFQDLLNQQEEMQEKLQVVYLEAQSLTEQLSEAKIQGHAALRALLEACFKSSEKLALRAISDNDALASGTSTYFLMVAEELRDILTKLELVHANYLKDDSPNVESLARKVIIGGHLLATAHVQGMAVCNNSADIECGERIAEQLKDFGNSIAALFTALNTLSESNTVRDKIADIRVKLDKVTTMMGDLSKKTDSTEPLGDLVEQELAQMEKAIEEAGAKIADMLSQSRASDSGIKLEVNEKILESCTVLMQCIRILVQKAKILQAEIVALGKGSASAKEFYKRNHQWTEGLISAAKSVAQGANFLVSAANKTVSGESKHQLDLIVAAQEIAACTAQLVVASRVKARNSSNLHALGQASKNVSQATGVVVATAKNCSERLEDSNDLDLSKLTIHQAKTREMEVQVKVLELEQALQVERLKLSALRRTNYQS